MASTQIRGTTQIQALTIADAQVATAAAIQTSKLQDGALFVKSDGTVAMGASLNLNTHTITNVVDPVNPQDAATRAWVLANAAGGVVSSTSVMVATTACSGDNHSGRCPPWCSMSKCHLYWTGMNGSGSTGRTRACHRRAYNNLDAGGSITRVRGNIYAGYGREIRRPTYEMQNIPYIPVRDEAWDRWLASAPESENIEDRRPEEDRQPKKAAKKER